MRLDTMQIRLHYESTRLQDMRETLAFLRTLKDSRAHWMHDVEAIIQDEIRRAEARCKRYSERIAVTELEAVRTAKPGEDGER